LPRLFERNQRITWGCLKIRKNFGTPIPFPDLQSISLHIFQSIFFFVGAPAGLSSLNPLSRGPDISSDALNAVFGAHVIDLPILDRWTVRSVRSVTGLGKPGLTNEKKKWGLPVNFCHQFYVVRNTTPGKMS
jgi:hypothetical protein